MDRQTIRYPDGAVELKCSVNDAVMLLAEYEDTGFEPEAIDTFIQILNENIGRTVKYDNTYITPCKNCSNNPANGGSGICNCTLGMWKVTF